MNTGNTRHSITGLYLYRPPYPTGDHALLTRYLMLVARGTRAWKR